MRLDTAHNANNATLAKQSQTSYPFGSQWITTRDTSLLMKHVGLRGTKYVDQDTGNVFFEMEQTHKGLEYHSEMGRHTAVYVDSSGSFQFATKMVSGLLWKTLLLFTAAPAFEGQAPAKDKIKGINDRKDGNDSSPVFLVARATRRRKFGPGMAPNAWYSVVVGPEMKQTAPTKPITTLNGRHCTLAKRR